MLKKMIVLIFLSCSLFCLSACGKSWTCDQCGKDFHGDAYYDYSETMTLCADCARTYWMPLPYQNYKK